MCPLFAAAFEGGRWIDILGSKWAILELTDDSPYFSLLNDVLTFIDGGYTIYFLQRNTRTGKVFQIETTLSEKWEWHSEQRNESILSVLRFV